MPSVHLWLRLVREYAGSRWPAPSSDASGTLQRTARQQSLFPASRVTSDSLLQVSDLYSLPCDWWDSGGHISGPQGVQIRQQVVPLTQWSCVSHSLSNPQRHKDKKLILKCDDSSNLSMGYHFDSLGKSQLWCDENSLCLRIQRLVQFPVLSCSRCVTLEKLLGLSEPSLVKLG
jgi:hypothetical protein